MVEGQATSMGRNSSRHVRRCTRGEHSQRGRSCSQPCISQQEHQVQPAIQHPHFLPSALAIETTGTWHYQAVELIQVVGRRTANITGDLRETTYLFQQLSIALQRGNAVSFQSTFTTS